jgi:hypothetical protein
MDKDQFLTAALRNPANEIIAEELHRLALPDAWLVSGCLVQTAWNVLTKRAVDYGINDYDVFYFDPDTSWEAEDKIIRMLTERLSPRGIAVALAHQRAFGRIARDHRRAEIVAARPVEIGLRQRRAHGYGRRQEGEHHHTRPEQATSPHLRVAFEYAFPARDGKALPPRPFDQAAI